MPDRRRRRPAPAGDLSQALLRNRLSQIRLLAFSVGSAFGVVSEVGLVQTAKGETSRTPHVSRPTEAIATSPHMAAQRRQAERAMVDADSHVQDALSSLRAAEAALRRPFREPGAPGGMKDGQYPGAMPREELEGLQARAEARRSRGEE